MNKMLSCRYVLLECCDVSPWMVKLRVRSFVNRQDQAHYLCQFYKNIANAHQSPDKVQLGSKAPKMVMFNNIFHIIFGKSTKWGTCKRLGLISKAKRPDTTHWFREYEGSN
jgi:hypothetical protein